MYRVVMRIIYRICKRKSCEFFSPYSFEYRELLYGHRVSNFIEVLRSIAFITTEFRIIKLLRVLF